MMVILIVILLGGGLIAYYPDWETFAWYAVTWVLPPLTLYVFITLPWRFARKFQWKKMIAHEDTILIPFITIALILAFFFWVKHLSPYQPQRALIMRSPWHEFSLNTTHRQLWGYVSVYLGLIWLPVFWWSLGDNARQITDLVYSEISNFFRRTPPAGQRTPQQPQPTTQPIVIQPQREFGFIKHFAVEWISRGIESLFSQRRSS